MKAQIVAAALISLASSANAFPWTVTKKGPDVFGDTHVTAFTMTDDGNDALRIECDNNTAPTVAILERSEGPFEHSLPGIRVIFRAGPGTLISATGTAGPWNDKTIALAVINEPSEVAQILDLLAAAKSKIGVGLILPNGTKFPLSFSSAGSTNAIAKIRAGCPAP